MSIFGLSQRGNRHGEGVKSGDRYVFDASVAGGTEAKIEPRSPFPRTGRPIRLLISLAEAVKRNSEPFRRYSHR